MSLAYLLFPATQTQQQPQPRTILCHFTLACTVQAPHAIAVTSMLSDQHEAKVHPAPCGWLADEGARC